MKYLKLIVCVDNQFGIGKNGSLPWNNSEEMKIFKCKTIGNGNNCVIMGRKTYESIPHKYFPLSKRHNIVLSSSLKNKTDHVSVIETHYELVEKISHNEYDEYWVIGGESVYDFFLKYYKNLISEIHISILNENYDCDRYFNKNILEYFDCVEEINHNTFSHFIYKNFKLVD